MESFIQRPQDPLNIDIKNIDNVAKSFANLLTTPYLSSANFLQDSPEFLNVRSQWTFVDAVTNEKPSFVRQFSILKSSLAHGNPIVASSPPIPYANVKLTRFSQTGAKKAVLTPATDSGGKPDENLQGDVLRIYDNEKMLKTFDLKKLDKHKEIYTNDQWGSTLVWSQDETKLAYLAEKKVPKAESFLDIKASDAEPSKDAPRKGEEFAFRQSWGEQLLQSYQSVIVILDLYSEEFNVLELPDKLFPSDLQWVNNSSIIGTGYVDSQWRLGLIYCTNRESRIFEIGIDGNNFRYLSGAKRGAMCPRVNPDSTFLIWQERDAMGPHRRAMGIMGLELKTPLEAPKTLYLANPRTLIPIYENFAAQCWSLDGRKFYVVTPNELDSILLEFEISSDYRLTGDPTVMRGIDAIYSIEKEHVLASRSSTIESPALLLITIEGKKIVQLSESSRIVSRPVYRLQLTTSVSPASFYYGPTGDDVKKKSIPLVVMPHGGPHSVFPDTFVPELALLLNLGYGILRVNYVGSIGATTDVTETLCGKIGVSDLQDVAAIVQSLLSQEPNLDPTKVVASGGSHGGFLGAHLSSSYPDLYKAVALRNPVTDLLSMVSMSDITDWSYVESGIKNASNSYLPVVSTLDDARKYMERSPIQQASKVKGATLLLLGSEDLRVPMSQGMAYYRALLAAGKTAEVRIYKDCHSLGKVPSRVDSMLHTILWFSKYLK